MEKETIFYEHLNEQIRYLGKNLNQVERELNYPRNALNNYKHGGEPSGRRLLDLSHYFGVSPEYLLGYSDKKHKHTNNLRVL